MKRLKLIGAMLILVGIAYYIYRMQNYGGFIHHLIMIRKLKWFTMNRYYVYPAIAAVVILCISQIIKKIKSANKEKR